MEVSEEGIAVIHIGHLGIISAIIQELGIIEKIDKRILVSKTHGSIVTMGQRVAAMILNGLGFLNDRLYLHPKFFEDKPIGRLLGEGIAAEHLNDDALGRALDAIHEYGTTQLLSEIAFEISQEKQLLGKTARLDTTSLSLYGDYPEQTIENETNPSPVITYGYSKDHRYDLKQIILSLTSSGPAGFPLWMEALDGNASDKKSFHDSLEKMTEFQKGLKEAPSFIFVADSALYTIDKLLAAPHLRWITRVPENISEARDLCGKAKDYFTWIELENGYQMAKVDSEYGGMKQRWQLIYSKQAYERESKTLERKIQREADNLKKTLWHLGNQVFSCQKDAEKALKAIIKKIKYHTVSYHFQPVQKHQKRGRPSRQATTEVCGYTIHSEYSRHLEAIKQMELRLGRFILATNELDANKLSDNEVLTEYKSLSKTENCFRFIKDDQFCISSVFLKTPSRVEALMMVMTLCVMVYNFGQYKIRQVLKNHQDNIPDQKGKPTEEPTLQWVFRTIDTVSFVRFRTKEPFGFKEVVANIKGPPKKIIGYFGEQAKKIYGVE